jgi:LSD1 subclass zinc finger protein
MLTRNLLQSVIFLLLLLFGLAAMPLAYLLHFPSSDEMNALAGQMGLYFFFGIAQLIAAVVLQGLAALGKARGVWSILQILFRWLPHYNVGIVLFKLSQNQAQPAYAQLSPWHKDISGTELKVMLVEAFVFATLTLCVDYSLLLRLEQLGLRLLALLFAGETTTTTADDESSDDDDDVAAERHRIVESGGDAGDLLTLQDMRKTYRGGKQAVKGVTIGVPEGSCFGLLGLNGAGKSTTFKMLTGEEAPTRGDALVRGRAGSAAGERPCSVVHELDAVRQRIGFCPQEDALCARLTCREHVLLYAAIRGLSPAAAAQLSDELLPKLGLGKWTHALAGTLSGGNKRKLSASIALVGDPPLALYDEPSSGMDPEARRSMWNVLATTMEGRATVLTTHVLAEAEALCHSVGIMVAGRLRCLGSLTHLKQTHGSGYTLEVRCSPAHAGRVATALASALPSARLQEEQAGRLTYALPTAQRLGDAFDALEALRSTPAVGVQDFSVTQSSLEQIFIGFATTCQEGGRKGGKGAGRGEAGRSEETDGELCPTGVECPACKAVLRWRNGASVMRCGACQALVGLPHVDGQHPGESEA